jgi:hypothetical protein
MRLVVRALAIVLVGGLLLAGPSPIVRAQDTGSIVGQITNGTAGAAVPADLDVVVHVLQNRVKTGEQHVRTDASGAFRLDGLAVDPNTLYFPIVTYGDVPYYPDHAAAITGTDPVPVDIAIFEATPTPDAVSFERLNLLIMGVTPTALTMMQMGAVINGGDRTFAADASVTGSGRTLRFVLPPGAMDVMPQAGLQPDALESTPDGFAATDPVRPGRRELAFSYDLPYSSSTLDLTQSFALPVGSFTLFVPPDVGDVVGPGMAFQGTADFGGRTFRQYSVQNVRPGTDVRFRLTGLPAPLFAKPRDLGLAVAGFAGVLLLACLILALRRRAVQGPVLADTTAPEAGVADDEALDAIEDRADLVQSIAELDERHARGGLDAAAYQAERAEQKARLLELTRQVAALGARPASAT